jgi:hypothetical protein
MIVVSARWQNHTNVEQLTYSNVFSEGQKYVNGGEIALNPYLQHKECYTFEDLSFLTDNRKCSETLERTYVVHDRCYLLL